MTDDWDAVVIGAGPAGAVAAREIARHGRRVLLVDRARFPRDKVCGCCLNGNAIAALRRLGLGHVLHVGVPLSSMMLAAGEARATLRLAAGVAIARSVFDNSLVREATAAGASFLDGTVARVESRTDRSVHVRIGERTIEAKVAILASGLAGGESEVSARSRIGGGVWVPPEAVTTHYTSGRLFMATAPGGYVGLVRLAGGSLDVAAAFDASFVRQSGGLGPAADAILASTGWPAIPGLAERPWKGTPALTRRRVAVAEHRLFAVGDATGYVEPFTGEGMAWAISSAAALAPIALRAIRSWRREQISEWQRVHTRIVGRRQWLCRATARVLRSPGLTSLAVRTLAAAPVLARPFVFALDHPARLDGRHL